MEVNVISPEERAKVEGKSYLRSRLAGFNVTTGSPMQHAHRANFIAPENSVPRADRCVFPPFFKDLTVLRMRPYGVGSGRNRRRDPCALHLLDACGAIPVSSGNQRTEQLRWEATANGQTPKQNRAEAKPCEALHGRHFQFQLQVRSRYGAANV